MPWELPGQASLPKLWSLLLPHPLTALCPTTFYHLCLLYWLVLPRTTSKSVGIYKKSKSKSIVCPWCILALLAGSWHNASYLGYSTCQRIVPFWDEILPLYDALVGDKYPNQPPNPETLYAALDPTNKLGKVWLDISWQQPRSVTARCWWQPEPPSLAAWACEIKNIEYMESMIARDKDTPEFHSLM